MTTAVDGSSQRRLSEVLIMQVDLGGRHAAGRQRGLAGGDGTVGEGLVLGPAAPLSDADQALEEPAAHPGAAVDVAQALVQLVGGHDHRGPRPARRASTTVLVKRWVEFFSATQDPVVQQTTTDVVGRPGVLREQGVSLEGIKWTLAHASPGSWRRPGGVATPRSAGR